MKNRHVTAILASAAMGSLVTGAALAQDAFMDVGEQAPITILINASPWYNGFEAVVELYEEQTGNVVNLEVTPFDGMVEKARTAVRSPGTSPYDIVNIVGVATIEFYEGGFLTPLKEIDPDFEVPSEVYAYGDSGCWDADKRFRTCETGELMGYSPNGNIQLFYYRADLYEEKGLKPPVTFDDVLANCKALHNPPDTYGYLQRGEKGDGIYYDFMSYFVSHGAKAEADVPNGDFTVTVNSPEAKAALDKYIEIGRTCGPDNYGTIGQGDLIQLLQTGKGAQAHAVVAAFPNFDNPQKSAVVGKIQASVLPRVTADGEPGVAIGNWVFAVPKNASEEGKKGAIAFSKWFLTYDAQYAYTEGGGIPVREDVFSSDLKDREEFRWMAAYQEAIPHGVQLFGYAEGNAVTLALGLRLNQALIGEMSSAEALNKAAEDIEAIFARNGRKTGRLPPLAE
ncbi:MAG TPA: extracellular solute-binding protein [Methylomirabilota bacterium]|nr:extracellular solute-binding protein [Methylomirabilota bacterium]